MEGLRHGALQVGQLLQDDEGGAVLLFLGWWCN